MKHGESHITRRQKILLWCRRLLQYKTPQTTPRWSGVFAPHLPVIAVFLPTTATSDAALACTVEALKPRYNILLCTNNTDLRKLKRKIKSFKNFQCLLFNRELNLSLLRFCRKRGISLIFLAENGDCDLTKRGGRDADKIIYASQSVFHAVKTRKLYGYPLDLTILSRLDAPDILADEMAGIIEETRHAREREKDNVNFLLETQPIDVAYWSGGKRTGRLREKDAAHYLRLWRNGSYPLRPVAGFHPGIYAEHHHLINQTGSCIDPFIHYLRAGQLKGPWCWPVLRNSLPLSDEARQARIALHIHAFYIDLLPDIIKRLRANRIRPDLFISVANERAKEQAASHLAAYEANCTIRLVPNRGRDIGPLFTEFGKQLVAGYDIIGHVHTKKTLHRYDRTQVNKWRQFLFENLLGDGKSLASADTIVQKMYEDPNIHLVFPDDRNAVSWSKNFPEAEKLAPQLGLDFVPKFCNFPVGTMFWTSSSCLRRFVDINLNWEDYPQEPLDIDGTMLHALERMFPLVCKEGEVITTLISKQYR